MKSIAFYIGSLACTLPIDLHFVFAGECDCKAFVYESKNPSGVYVTHWFDPDSHVAQRLAEWSIFGPFFQGYIIVLSLQEY